MNLHEAGELKKKVDSVLNLKTDLSMGKHGTHFFFWRDHVAGDLLGRVVRAGDLFALAVVVKPYTGIELDIGATEVLDGPKVGVWLSVM